MALSCSAFLCSGKTTKVRFILILVYCWLKTTTNTRLQCFSERGSNFLKVRKSLDYKNKMKNIFSRSL